MNSISVIPGNPNFKTELPSSIDQWIKDSIIENPGSVVITKLSGDQSGIPRKCDIFSEKIDLFVHNFHKNFERFSVFQENLQIETYRASSTDDLSISNRI